MHIIMMPNMTSTKLSRSKRYCRTWLGSHFRALPVYIKRGCAALRVACVVSSSHKHAQDSSRADRAAPAIYDDLHNCVGWPPSDSSSSTVFDSHSVPSKARVLTCKPPLKTVDSLFFTGEKEHVQKSVSFAEQRSQTQRKRTEASTGSFDGPIIDIALVACLVL